MSSIMVPLMRCIHMYERHCFFMYLLDITYTMPKMPHPINISHPCSRVKFGPSEEPPIGLSLPWIM